MLEESIDVLEVVSKSTSIGAWLPGRHRRVEAGSGQHPIAAAGAHKHAIGFHRVHWGQALIGQAVGQTGGHGVGVGGVLQPRSVPQASLQTWRSQPGVAEQVPRRFPNRESRSPGVPPHHRPGKEHHGFPESQSILGATKRQDVNARLTRQGVGPPQDWPRRWRSGAHHNAPNSQRWPRSVRARISSGRYTVPNSVGLEMVTTPGAGWCTSHVRSRR